MRSAVDRLRKRGPERDLAVKRFKAKNGFVDPPKIFGAVMSGINLIVLDERSLRYVRNGLDYNKFLDNKERKRVMELIRTAFPSDYFKKKAGREFVNRHPEIQKAKRDDSQLNIHFRRHMDSF